jgi:uncharacterized membrane protein
MKKLIYINKILFFWLLSTASTWAQSPSTQTDFLESSGKIYVVVAVLALIFLGVIILLISLERRLARLEKDLKDE